jgi:hypothetical protein
VLAAYVNLIADMQSDCGGAAIIKLNCNQKYHIPLVPYTPTNLYYFMVHEHEGIENNLNV